MIELLGTYTEDNASQARDDAQKYVVVHSNIVCFIISHGFSFLCPHKVAAYRVALVRTYVPKIVSDLILENYLSNPHQTLNTYL